MGGPRAQGERHDHGHTTAHAGRRRPRWAMITRQRSAEANAAGHAAGGVGNCLLLVEVRTCIMKFGGKRIHVPNRGVHRWQRLRTRAQDTRVYSQHRG